MFLDFLILFEVTKLDIYVFLLFFSRLFSIDFVFIAGDEASTNWPKELSSYIYIFLSGEYQADEIIFKIIALHLEE